MVKHVLFAKLRDNSVEKCKETLDLIKSMQGKVPAVKNIETGIDFLHTDRSYDIAFVVTVDDENALNAYQNDNYHIEVIRAYMKENATSTVIVDYKI